MLCRLPRRPNSYPSDDFRILLAEQVTAGMHTSDLEWMALAADGANKPRRQPGPPTSGGGSSSSSRENKGSPAGATNPANPLALSAAKVFGGEILSSDSPGKERHRMKGLGSGKRPREGHANAGADAGANASRNARSAHGPASGDSEYPRRGKIRGPPDATARERCNPKQGKKGRRKPSNANSGGRGKGAAAVGVGSTTGRRRRCPPSELAKRAELLEALVLWTFEGVIVPLVRVSTRPGLL